MWRLFFAPPSRVFSSRQRYPLLIRRSRPPSAARTRSRPSASASRLGSSVAGGRLSIPSRTAVSEAISASNEKCSVSCIALPRI